jgi:ABC-2 type transport system ATP-binding protein
VTSYVSRVHAPTLLVQGQNDTLFNLQEAVATYDALRAQGTPVRMVWQSWGHSGGTPAPGELDLTGARDLETTYLGRRFLAWFDHWLKGEKSAPLGPGFAWFEDWVPYDGSAPAGAEPAYGTAKAYPVGTTRDFYLSGDRTLTTAAGDVVPGAQSWANAADGPTSYSETSAVEGSTVDNPPYDAPGTFASWTSAPLPSDLVTVGVPSLDVRLDSPAAAVSQQAGPGGHLVLFAKLYDVAPDGTQTLQHRLISPVRVADVMKVVHIELPGVAQQWKAGHRIRLVLAASDAAYAGNTAVLPVSVTTDPAAPPVLHLPVLG